MLYVNPATGNDAAAGHQSAPLKTLTQALRKATVGTTIRLAAGTYSAANGERFPLVVPSGITVSGNEAIKGRGISIAGNGQYRSPTLGIQNITLRLQGQAQLRGVTAINQVSGGTAVWIESATPTVANNTLSHCGREGVLVTGTAKPLLVDNVLTDNAVSGMTFARNAKGEVQRNLFQETGDGLAIRDRAAPLINDNRLLENRIGLTISQEARPVLRRNRIEGNTQGGISLRDRAAPDFGQSQDPAGNVLLNNRLFDVQNNTKLVLVSAGNQLNPSRVEGPIKLEAGEVPILKPDQDSSGFRDMVGHWSEPFIAAMVGRGLISGFPDGSFRPEENLTRAQYAAIVSKAFQQSAQRSRLTFSDVPVHFWAYSAISRAQQMGFIAGFPDGSFRPQQNLTRTQAIISLVSGLGLRGGNSDSLRVYRDRAQIPSYAIAAIATAVERRMLAGQPQTDTLEPLRDITRAEATTLIYQALVTAGQASPIASGLLVVTEPALPAFFDLEGHWSIPFIQGLTAQSLIGGFTDGSFRPNVPMTRAQYAALLARAFNPQSQRPERSFSDVPEDFWAASAIQKAYQGRFLSGFPDSTFAPNKPILRAQALAALVQGLGLTAGSINLLNRYSDQQEIPDYARTAVVAATQHQLVIVEPPGQQLRSQTAATRAEAAAMVYQALVRQGRLPAIDSPYIIANTP